MAQKIVLNIILTIIGVLTTSSVGYLVHKAKTYRDNLKSKENNEKTQNIALQTILQSQLTNTYFVYNELKEIPDYVYKNWLNLLKAYEELNGDDYIHTLAEKMKQWEITKTDILK